MAQFLNNLVSYSGSSSEESENEDESDKSGKKESTKRRTTEEPIDTCPLKIQKTDGVLPPVPSNIAEMYKDKDEDKSLYEDSSLHGGRQRTFEHVRGNWPTHLYIPVEKSSSLCELAASLIHNLPGKQTWSVCEEFHISVSRTVTIRHHWIEPLVQSLREKLQLVQSVACEWNSVEIYTNDDKTRSFLCLKVDFGHSDLLAVVKDVDNCFTDFKLPVYYKPPSFHVSLCWALGDQTPKITKDLKTSLQEIFSNHKQSDDELCGLYANEVHCKTGNKLFKFELSER